jgi:hypothetical protein
MSQAEDGMQSDDAEHWPPLTVVFVLAHACADRVIRGGMQREGGKQAAIAAAFPPPLPRCVLEYRNREVDVLQHTSCLHREIAVQYGFKNFLQYYFPLLAGVFR